MARAKIIFAPVESPDRFANLEQRQTYSLPFFEIDPTAADDLVVYLRNTGVKPIEIYRVNVVQAAATGIVLLQKVTGTQGGGGATIVAVNMDLGSSEDYSGNIEAITDPDITGLTEVATLDTFGAVTGGETPHSYPEGILLRQNNAVALSVGTATTIVSGNIFFRVLPEEF